MRLITIILVGIFILGCKRSPESIVSYSPPENASYQHEDVVIKLQSGDMLAGSLTYQDNNTEFIPAAILITGSSPHDRDNSKPDNPIDAYRPFRQISDVLSSNGIAVLRVDDRGVGKSIGGNISKRTLPKILRRDNNLKFLFDFDPLETIRLIHQPVLIIQGKTDRRVPFTDAFILADELRKSGNEQVTVHVLPEYNHALLKEGKISSSKIPDEVLTLILKWVQKEI